MPDQHILIFGNPVDGFKYLGPFYDSAEASNYPEVDSRIDGDWWVTPLESPAYEQDQTRTPHVWVFHDQEADVWGLVQEPEQGEIQFYKSLDHAILGACIHFPDRLIRDFEGHLVVPIFYMTTEEHENNDPAREYDFVPELLFFGTSWVEAQKGLVARMNSVPFKAEELTYPVRLPLLPDDLGPVIGLTTIEDSQNFLIGFRQYGIEYRIAFYTVVVK